MDVGDSIATLVGGIMIGFVLGVIFVAHNIGDMRRNILVECGAAHYDAKTGEFVMDGENGTEHN